MNDFLRLQLEEPSGGTIIFRNAVLRANGWAIAASGIRELQIWLDEDGPHSAHYGLLREDVALRHRDVAGASHSGFFWVWHTGSLQPGMHQLRLVCTANSGITAETNTSFQIDSKSEYELWAALNEPDRDQLLAWHRQTEELAYAPQFTLITPVHSANALLDRCIRAVKRQVYADWELLLLLGGDSSAYSALVFEAQKQAGTDRRIRAVQCDGMEGLASVLNCGLEAAKGQYVAVVGEADEIAPDALMRAAEALNRNSGLDIIYSDEDQIDESGAPMEPYFKPAWSPDLLLSRNYIGRLCVIRKSLLEEAGGFRTGFEGAEEYDLLLRLSERTAAIYRIARVLYHGRVRDEQTDEAGRRALEEHLARTGAEATVVDIAPGRYRTKYRICREPRVSVIIPTGGSTTFEAALESIFALTSYSNYDIVAVDNSSTSYVREAAARFAQTGNRMEVIDCQKLAFNFSLLCNRAARATASPYLLFLNDDTSVIAPEWMEALLEHAQRAPVGAAGALLLFPNGTIQHAGIAAGLFRSAGHPFRGLSEQPYYFDATHLIRNCAAVTGACLMMRRDVFESVGGFDERNLPTVFQDVDLCLRILEQGLGVVYTPFAKLFHHESLSKKAAMGQQELAYFRERWRSYIADDPYYNPNLTRNSEDLNLRYDHLILDEARGLSVTARTPSVRKLSRFGAIEFSACASDVDDAGVRVGPKIISWKVPGAEKVHVRIGSPMGPLFTEGGASGSAMTGSWVESETVFYLLDATEQETGSPERVLAVLRIV